MHFKKSLFILIIFLYMAPISSASSSSTREGLTFEKLNHDFGNLQEGIITNYSFVGNNLSDSAIKLKKVVSSCDSCLKAEVSKQIVEPEEEFVVEAVINTQGKSGSYSKNIYLHTDSKNTPVVILTTKFTV